MICFALFILVCVRIWGNDWVEIYSRQEEVPTSKEEVPTPLLYLRKVSKAFSDSFVAHFDFSAEL